MLPLVAADCLLARVNDATCIVRAAKDWSVKTELKCADCLAKMVKCAVLPFLVPKDYLVMYA